MKNYNLQTMPYKSLPTEFYLHGSEDYAKYTDK